MISDAQRIDQLIGRFKMVRATGGAPTGGSARLLLDATTDLERFADDLRVRAGQPLLYRSNEDGALGSR